MDTEGPCKNLSKIILSNMFFKSNTSAQTVLADMSL